MSYLIDSDWVIPALKGRPAAHTLFATLVPQPLAISIMTYGEVYEGIYFGHNPQHHEQVFRQFLKGVTVLPLNRRIMERFATIRGTLRQQGQIIGDPDIIIAATAIHHGLILVTQNMKHFQRIPGLVLHP